MQELFDYFSPRLFDNEKLGVVATFVGLICTAYLIFYGIRSIILATRSQATRSKNDTIGEFVGVCSILGTRNYQQDCADVGIREFDGFSDIMAVVCDGMGGMDDGSRASKLCANSFASQWRIGQMISDKDMVYAVRKLNDEVVGFTNDSGESISSGTTLVAAVLHDKQLTWISIGDSRIYLMQNGSLRQLTRDHNYSLTLEDMVSAGLMNAADAASHRDRDALISYVGVGDSPLIDVGKLSLTGNEKILLCSDGVTKLLTDKEIQAIMSDADEPAQSTAERIIDRSVQNRTRSQDNTTAAVIKIK